MTNPGTRPTLLPPLPLVHPLELSLVHPLVPPLELSLVHPLVPPLELSLVHPLELSQTQTLGLG